MCQEGLECTEGPGGLGEVEGRDRGLNPKEQVSRILGFSLTTRMTWANCMIQL